MCSSDLAVRELLGAEQYKVFRSKKRTIGDMDDMISAAFEAVKIDPKA